MTRSLTITFLVICATLAACDRKKEGAVEKKDSAVQQDTFVKRTSHLGNSFVVPSLFTTTDKGDTFSLKSPDGQAIIHAIIFTAEGSGTFEEFQAMLASDLVPEKTWKPSQWTPFKLGDGHDAQKRDFVPVGESDQQWRLYAVDGDKFYHAILLNASSPMMTLQGGFYDNIIRSFEGVRE